MKLEVRYLVDVTPRKDMPLKMDMLARRLMKRGADDVAAVVAIHFLTEKTDVLGVDVHKVE